VGLASPAPQPARCQSDTGNRVSGGLPVSAGATRSPALQANQVIIVSGETGSGKTTQLPKIACRSGGARRARASRRRADRPHPAAPDRRHSTAKRIAQELGTPLGETVGYQGAVQRHDVGRARRSS
jgi:ATP-dependent helicase HrpA